MKRVVIVWIGCVLIGVLFLTRIGSGVLPGSSPSLIEGNFTLQAGDGRAVTERDFAGRYLLVYFGFTHCPDICPTTLLKVQNVLAQMGSQAEKIQPIFITVDPERDTPQVAAEYARHFGSQMMGLSGTPAQIKAVADRFKVYYSVSKDEGSALGYSVDHSGFLYLMGPDAGYLTHFSGQVSEQELLTGLKTYVR